MKRNEIRAAGQIDANGKFKFYLGELNDFAAHHKGERVVVTFRTIGTSASEALKGYYFNYIVPTMRRAIWESGERLTQEDAEEFLRKLSPIMRAETADEITGKYNYRLRGIHELTNAELIEHIDTLKQIAAEEYGVYIEDPNTL